MFGENKGVQMPAQFCRKTVSAFLVFSFAILSLSSTMKASDGKLDSGFRKSAKQKFTTDVKLDDFQADVFAGATKISWRTSYEQNVIGFKIWREDQGQKILVNQEFIAGSLLKVGNGILPAGNEYNFYDQTDSTNVYYWLEAVDINSQSVWFGPVYPQMNFDLIASDRESQTISGLGKGAKEASSQIDRVDFSAALTNKRGAPPIIQPVDVSLIANDPNALKIEVRNRGIYRVDAQTLENFGFNRAQSAKWRLFAGGIEQPIIVNADGSIEFFGQGLDTVQTDTNIYWLITDVNVGRRISRATQKFISSARTSSTRFIAERKDKTLRISGVLNGARENWFGAVVNSTPVNQTLTLNDIATDSGQTATIGIDLQGITATSHQIVVLLNGISIGQINLSFYARSEWTANVPLSRLVEGANTLTLQAVGGSSDVNVIEAIRINYPRNLKAIGNKLDFSLAGGQAVKLTGFTVPQVRVLDVTNPSQVTEFVSQGRMESDGTYSFTVASASNARVLTVVNPNAPLLSASGFAKNTPSQLKTAQNKAKFVLVAPTEFKDALAGFVNSKNQQGMQTEVVEAQDIYDEFNYGVRSAEAIRSFLQYAKTNWTVKPEFAMFVGDASVDPRNYSGLGGYVNNRVPSILVDTWNMETVSDELMADFNGDSVGEIALGRLPAKDLDELQSMLDKIMQAEPMTRQMISDRGVHFVSDGPNGYDFPLGSRNMATYIPSSVNVNYLDSIGQSAPTVRADIVNRINSGAAIVNYFGHASIAAWSGSLIFRNADTANLSNSNTTLFMAMIDCMNGDFAETEINGLAEAALKQRNGGANAVWASTGWNGAFEQEYYTKDFYQKVFSGMPLGEAARQTKILYPIPDLRRTYVFLGDPTQPLVLP